MRRPTFVQGVCAAAVFAVVGSIAVTALQPVAIFPGVYHWLSAALGLAYLLYILSFSRERAGRLTALSLWAAMSFALWLLNMPIGLYVLLQIAALWLLRSLYAYGSVFSALMDLVLNLIAAATAYWAAVHTGSVFLTLWCFFLVQALFVAIPPTVNYRSMPQPMHHADTENFERARLRAEKAIRQLFAQ